MKIISTNPSRNYEVVGEVEVFSEQELQNVYQKALKAQPKWAALRQVERNDAIESFMVICKEHTEQIATVISSEMGKPISMTRQDIQESIDYFHAFMELADTALSPEVVYEDDTQKHTQVREPYGVLACISPWNFPFFNIPFQFGVALLSGNTVLWKPSEEIIVYAKLIAELIEESDMPEGVLTVILGDGKVGEQLLKLPVDGVLFTGSTRTGQLITKMVAGRNIPVLTEMGGSSPGIIFEDADVDATINSVYDMRFTNTGQWCDGLKRLLVHETKLDAVLEGMKRVNETKTVGDSLSEDTNIGPLVAKRQLDLLEGQVEDAVNKGAKVLFGGKRPEGLEGAYYKPTVLTDITFNMRVWKEEVFGPVLPVITFKTEEEAIKLANDTAYGLTAFVFTTNNDRYLRVASKLQAGSIGHNNVMYFSPMSPFGGYKGSGNSRVCGVEGFHEVTQVKLISEEGAAS